jgi:hypothetical protein
MAHDVSITQDVAHANSTLRQCSTHEETSVAVQRIALGAHESNPIFLCTLEDAIQSFVELGGLRHALVIGNAITVKLAIRRTTSQFLTQKHVHNPICTQLVQKTLAIKVRKLT